MPEQRLQSYAVRLKGHLDASWVEECLLNHFAQIVVQHEPQGETRLACRHFDQAGECKIVCGNGLPPMK